MRKHRDSRGLISSAGGSIVGRRGVHHAISGTGNRGKRLWLAQVAGMQCHTEMCQCAGGRRTVLANQCRHLMAEVDSLARDRLPDKAGTTCNEQFQSVLQCLAAS